MAVVVGGEAGDGSGLLQAGAEAVGRGELREALELFEQAVAVETGDLRVCAMVNAATVTDHLGEHAEAVRRYRAALDLMPADAPRMRPGALIGLSQAQQHLGDLDGAQAALEEARLLLSVEGASPELRFATLVSATAVAMHRQQWAVAIELANESLDAARRFAPEQAGHALMNLAAAHFETGRWELAEDFAGQSLAAFEAAGDVDGVAETQQNLALMFTRAGRFDEAEPLLLRSQEHFETGGAAYRAGIGWKITGFIAEHRGDTRVASDRYRQALTRFEESGAVIDAADVRMRSATVAFAAGRFDDGESDLAAARATYLEHGLGLHCAQLDFWHAGLLAPLVESDPEILTRAVDLAVTSAIALDAVRYELPDGAQRENWNRRMADPALRLAFRYAYQAGDATLVIDLIETLCAGTTLDLDQVAANGRTHVDLPESIDTPLVSSAPLNDALQLGTALAAVAAGAGLPVAPPPRVAVPPDGRIALDAWIAAAEQRYGRPLRDDRVIPA